MKKRIHYLPKDLSILGSAGTAACGMYISEKLFGDNMTTNKQDVTCGNCLRSRIYKETIDQQTCGKCGRIVGCDYRGRKHRCDCGK